MSPREAVPTMVFDDTLLADPERVAEADTAGLLRALAMAGAQVRATSDAAAEARLAERLDVGSPRVIVLVAGPGGGGTALALLAELLATSTAVPVVAADVVPHWVGALDVVFAHSDDPGDLRLATGLERAVRRGTTVVVSAPDEGPVAAAVAGHGVLVSPLVRVPMDLSFPRALTAGLLTANALGVLAADVVVLADQLDEEAAWAGPSNDPDSNPAKTLALRLAEHTPLLVGMDQVAVAVARHAEHAVAAHAGTACHVTEYRQLQMRRTLYQAALSASAERNIFADPDDLDGMGNTFRVILLGVRGGTAADAARQHATQLFPTAQRLFWDVAQPSEEPAPAAVSALRCEFAAAYLGLASGTTGGSTAAAVAGM